MPPAKLSAPRFGRAAAGLVSFLCLASSAWVAPPLVLPSPVPALPPALPTEIALLPSKTSAGSSSLLPIATYQTLASSLLLPQPSPAPQIVFPALSSSHVVVPTLSEPGAAPSLEGTHQVFPLMVFQGVESQRVDTCRGVGLGQGF